MSAPAASPPLDSRAALETPEHVALPVSLAGPVARGLAWGLDLLLRAMLALFASVVLSALGLVVGQGWGLGGLLVLLFLLDWGWYAAWEGFAGGQSPGKRVFGLRVLRADGTPIGPREAMLRNLLRAADVLPGMYLVGGLVSLSDPRFRRLGDLVAGTVVVREVAEAPLTEAARIEPPLAPTEVPFLPRNRRVGSRDHRALEDWLDATRRLGEVWSEWVAARVADAFADRYRVRAPRPERLLKRLIGAARAARPELDAASRAGEDQTRALRAVLDAGLTPRHPERAPELVWRLRAVVAELGRVREASPTRARAAEEAVWRAEVLLHRYRPAGVRLGVRPLLRLLFDEYPAALRRNVGWFLVANVLFYGPLVYCAVVVALDAEVAERLVPADVQGTLEASFGQGGSRATDDNASMAGFYVINNVGIALRAAGAGVLAGLGTAWVLISNGVWTGAAFGYCARVGALGNLLRFTCGHATWELTAIVVAGTCGFRLGAALLVPGTQSRMGSIRAAGPDALRLAAGAASMLLVAAAIEGFWSGWELPDVVKGGFAVAQALLVITWLRRGWR